ERGARPVRGLVAADGRVALLRRLRALEDRGLVTVDWTLLAAAAGPRYERWVRATDEGLMSARAIAAGGTAPGRPPGARQGAGLGELRGDAPDPAGPGLAAAPLGERHGTAALASLARRGLVALDVRERPRRPLAGRPPGLRGGRPVGSDLSPAQA